ncbi:MAG: tetratricopeptide repeat protein [Bacteroidales bacterium]|nr:tetratricopeptide repeat protein [Bacteroidales bacterium]
MKKYIGICIGVFFSVSLAGQNVDIRPYIEKGNQLYDSVDYRSAATQYKHALLLDSTSFDTWFNFASALYNLDKFILASDAFEHAQRLQEDSVLKAEALYGKGNCYVQLADYAKAVDVYKKSLLYNPLDSAAVYNYAYAKVLLDAEREREKQENESQDDDSDDDEKKPSEYAVDIKKRADELVQQYKFTEADELMREAMKKDETVEQFFGGFVKKISEVALIVEKHKIQEENKE